MCVMHVRRMAQEIDIKAIRTFRNWTQDDMGKHFGVDKATVWRWENWGVPSRGAARRALENEWDAVPVEARTTGTTEAAQ